MRPIGFGCQIQGHAHEIIVPGRSIGAEGHIVGILTLWRCPVLHTLGGYWNDLRRPAETIGGHGPASGLDAIS